MSRRKSVFLSVANAEFGPLRDQLREVLAGTFDVVVQPDFSPSASDTVRMLDDQIAPCDLLVHFTGDVPGSMANSDAVDDFFTHTDQESFLANRPRAKTLLGECKQLTYAQWEPWLAIHRDIDVLVFAVEGHDRDDFVQRDHLDCLYLARRFPTTLKDESVRLGQVIAAIFAHFKMTPIAPQQKIAPPRFLHHAAELFMGREDALQLLDEAWQVPKVSATTEDATDAPTNLLSIIAWGGTGKTALLAEWISTRFVYRQWKDDEGNPNPLCYFDWSFYDQGTASIDDGDGDTEDDDSQAGDSDRIAVRTGSVGDFFEQALVFFGDPDPNRPGKGQRLAELVQQQRSLLILDGLEPLQYPPGHDQAGAILDADLADLLHLLAMQNPGLCIVTSRQQLSGLSGLQSSGVREHELGELPVDLAVRLLRRMQITGSDDELHQACEDLHCHALSLTLVGRYLFDVHQGDIRRRDRIGLHRADTLTRSERKRTVWKVLETYEQWLASGNQRRRELAVLRLTGLFDRAARADCLDALREEPVIAGLTEPIVPLADDEWSILLHRLSRLGLVSLRADPEGRDIEPSLDAHPLIREYFSEQLRQEQPEAFRAAHSRLFDHLCKTTEHRPDTLDGLQPLYQAVVHGCLAERQQEACEKVYVDRILRGMDHYGYYSTKILGAIGEDLSAVAAFFAQPWTVPSPNLSERAQAWLLNEAAFSLHALGRLTEAVEPMRVTIERYEGHNAATTAGNLARIQLTLGRVESAVSDARRAVEFADRCEDWFERMLSRTIAADALHQFGDVIAAADLFATAESIQQEYQPQVPLLYSAQGFHFCDLLLNEAERAAWSCVLECGHLSLLSENDEFAPEDQSITRGADHIMDEGSAKSEHFKALTTCDEAEQRAHEAQRNWQEIFSNDPSVLDIARDQLTLARAGLYRAILIADPVHLHPSAFSVPSNLTAALNGLRKARQITCLPLGLLTAAVWHHLAGDASAATSALNEAQQIAARGPMPLDIADILLTRARLCGPLVAGASNVGSPIAGYPWRDSSPQADLAEARRIIEETHYHRRLPELEDAEMAVHHPNKFLEECANRRQLEAERIAKREQQMMQRKKEQVRTERNKKQKEKQKRKDAKNKRKKS